MYSCTKWGIVFEDWIMHTEVTGTVILLLKWPSYCITASLTIQVFISRLRITVWPSAGKELTSWLSAYAVLLYAPLNCLHSFPIRCLGQDVIVSVPDYCLFIYFSENASEPRHDKTNKVTVRPAKTPISLSIRPVWSEFPLSAWRKLGSFSYPLSAQWRLIRLGQSDLNLRWAHTHFVGFVMSRLKCLNIQSGLWWWNQQEP